ncbi:MAG: hypothetical protein WKG06_15855 [Segetibacter sp.]
MVTTNYQILFSIKLEHDYYGNNSFDDLMMVPSEETCQLLKDYKIVFRNLENVLVAMIQTKNNKPVIDLSGSMLFRFYLSLKNSSFLNFSSLSINNTTRQFYYFSNRRVNKKNERLYLSSPVPIYSDSNNYEVGTIVSNASRVFECIKANSNADKHDTTDTAFWRDIILHQSSFLTAYTDAQTFRPGDLTKVGQKVFECIKINSPTDKHDPSETLFWTEITEIAYVSSADLSEPGTIAAQNIPAYNGAKFYPVKSWVTVSGKYFEAIKQSDQADAHSTTDLGFWKEINADYILKKSSFSLPQNTFAVIDIYNGFGEVNDYTLLNPDNEVLQKTFYIRFKNRSTIWKYISQKNAVTGISDENGNYNFSNATVSNEFISNVPIPLTKKPLNSLKLTALINSRPVEITGLQNAGINMINPSNNTNNFDLFSEIYLNY